MLASLRVTGRVYREALRPIALGAFAIVAAIAGFALFQGLRVSVTLILCGAFLVAVGVRRRARIERIEQRRVLRTERLTIRPLLPADADAFVATIDAEVVSTLGLTDYFAEEAAPSIAKGEPQAHLAICDADGTVIGGCIIHPNTEPPRRCGIDVWIAPDHRRHGYALEAIEGFAFRLHRSGFREVFAHTPATNIAGMAMLGKAGFVAKGVAHVVRENGFPADLVEHVHVITAVGSPPAVAQTAQTSSVDAR